MSSSSGATLSRSLTRLLRDKSIDANIQCTSTLVASYNAEEDPKAREALRKWLEAYFYEFSQIPTGSISRKSIAEFVNLTKIKIKESADSELIRRVYTTLSEVILTKEGCSVYFVLGLEHVLSTIDKEILQQDARTLIALADRLTEMTDPKKMPLTRDTFEYQGSCLNASERVLMVLHDLEKERSSKPILKYFEDKTKRQLDLIISCQCYYPFVYQALLIKEHLNALLTTDIKSNLLNAGRRAFYAFCGGLYIFQGVRELAVMKLDFNVMVSGIEKIHQAFKDIGWDILPGVQEIVLAASETLVQNDFGVFQQCYDKHKKVSWLEGLKWSKQRAIRYAFVSHLCLFCTEKHSGFNQAPPLDLLVKLVTEDEGKQWRNDTHIFEAMIEALIAIGQQNQDFEEKVINAFNKVIRFQREEHKKLVDECLNGMTFEEKIRSGYKPQEDATSHSLYDSIRQKLGLHRTASIYTHNQEKLKNQYDNDHFAKVSLFEDNTEEHHIKNCEFNIVKCEKVVVFEDSANRTSQSDYNQLEKNMKRTLTVRKPLDIKDLFKQRGTHGSKLHENAQRTLVIGNPGTGKTCLSKRLCYDWANEVWGTEFTHVYWLPIRRLSNTLIGHCGDLPSIILQLIYQESAIQDCNKALYAEVKDNLSKSTTLLILDGYDEAGTLAMDLVSSSLKLGCCLLISSRPHSVQGIRPQVDIEVECLELSKKQLSSFICTKLDSTNANELLAFFSQNLVIRDTCCVAVNAQIIVLLWKSSYKRELIKWNCANLFGFYDMISGYLWTRFTDKDDQFDMNKTFDSLERIAFEAFQKGQVEIPEPLILKHAQGSMKIFCMSGFLLLVKEGNVFQFTHLTFHEYFAGRYLAKMLSSASEVERKRAARFISEHKYIETSVVMFSFMTQCYCMKDDIEANLEAFKGLMRVLDSDPVSSISLQHLFLRMRALDAFLPCGMDENQVLQTNDVVIHIVNDAMDALRRWFGYGLHKELGQHDLGRDSDFETPIIDELSRMPNLFNQFPDLLKPILLNRSARYKYDSRYRRNCARIGRLNPQYALQCILSMLDNWSKEEQASLIELCALIGPVHAEPTLDYLKRLYKDRDSDSRVIAVTALATFIDLFPERDDIRQLMLDALRDPYYKVRNFLLLSIKDAIFTRETEIDTFVWALPIEAMKEENHEVREYALGLCVQHYQTFTRSIDEVMEFLREFAISPNSYDRFNGSNAIKQLIPKAPEQSEELLALLKALCADPHQDVNSNAVDVFLEIARGSYLRREYLFNVAFDMFKDGYPNVQHKLLPFLFSFDKEVNRGIDEVNEWIATCQDLKPRVQERVDSCRAANALLSKYSIEEIHDKFDDQDMEVQREIVAQFDWREMESNKHSDAIANMAVHFLDYNSKFKPFKTLLERMSKIELFPWMVLKKLAPMRYVGRYCVQQQPLSHLLEYYWTTADPNMIKYIAEKLLALAVTFERKGETESMITFREKGAIVKRTAPVEVVQDLLSHCKKLLKTSFGLDFPHV